MRSVRCTNCQGDKYKMNAAIGSQGGCFNTLSAKSAGFQGCYADSMMVQGCDVFNEIQALKKAVAELTGGAVGPAGADGVDGSDGARGDRGPKGEAGARGPKGAKFDTLTEFKDVEVEGVQDGDFLQWNADTGKWTAVRMEN